MDNLKAVYPGSMFAGGFDEQGKHGMIEGEINSTTNQINIKFIPLDNKEFVKEEIDISNIYSEEELIENLNSRQKEENKYYEYIFIGNKNIEINTNKLLKFIDNNQVIKLKDISKLKYDLEQISKEKSLKGIFVKQLLEQIKEDESNKDEILRVIEIGINSMN